MRLFNKSKKTNEDLYYGYIQALNPSTGIKTIPLWIAAKNPDSAQLMANNLCATHFPLQAGWIRHNCSVAMMPRQEVINIVNNFESWN